MEKKNFLFVSLTGLISDIAWQVSKEGHEVRYYIDDKKERDIADGFVAKSKDWEKDVEWADIIIFDDTLGQGERAQALRDAGQESDRAAHLTPIAWKTTARSARKNSRKPASTSFLTRNSNRSMTRSSTWSKIPAAT